MVPNFNGLFINEKNLKKFLFDIFMFQFQVLIKNILNLCIKKTSFSWLERMERYISGFCLHISGQDTRHMYIYESNHARLGFYPKILTPSGR